VRPYFAGGIGVSMFSPTDEAKSQTVLGSSVDNTNKFHFNFGGGLRFKLSDHFGLDFSIRDFVHKSPDFGLSSGSDADYIHNMQLQGGLLFMFGDTKPPIVHTFNVGPDIQTGKKELCPGETTTLTVGASDSIPENKITYNWTVKGQPVGTSPECTFTAPAEPGSYEVKTKVFYDTSARQEKSEGWEKNPGSAAERSTQLIVKEYKPPQVTASGAARFSVVNVFA
jgi:hypothetical protein